MNRFKRYMTMLKIFCIRDGYKRGDYLRKIKYFNNCGEHCYFQPWNFGTEPEMLSFGKNVHIASGVSFVSHDITAMMFRYMDGNDDIKIRRGPITIGDNVFVGANVTLLYDVKIGNNVIIGAGSIVNKDIPDGAVAAGVPCKVIGSFEEYKNKIKGQK